VSILITILCETRQEAVRTFALMRDEAVCAALHVREAVIVDNCVRRSTTVRDAFVVETKSEQLSHTVPDELLGLLISLIYGSPYCRNRLGEAHEALLSILTDLAISNQFVESVTAYHHAIFLLARSAPTSDGKAVLRRLGCELRAASLAPCAERTLRQLLYA